MNDKPLETLRDLFASLASYLPTFFAGLFVVLLGALAAWIASKFVVRLLILMRLDRVVGRVRWGRAIQQGDVRHSLFGFIGNVFGLLVFLVFLDNAVTIWRLTVVSNLLERIVLFAPQLFTVTVVILVGVGLASAASRAVQRTLNNEGFERAQLAGRIVRGAILVVAVSIALVELNIAVTIVTGAFLLAFGALCLGGMLAFGLGSKKAVERMWDSHLNARGKSKPSDPEVPDGQ